MFLAEASRQVAMLAEELARRGEDAVRQQEEISQLLAQIVNLQQKCRSVSVVYLLGWTGPCILELRKLYHLSVTI